MCCRVVDQGGPAAGQGGPCGESRMNWGCALGCGLALAFGIALGWWGSLVQGLVGEMALFVQRRGSEDFR